MIRTLLFKYPGAGSRKGGFEYRRSNLMAIRTLTSSPTPSDSDSKPNRAVSLLHKVSAFSTSRAGLLTFGGLAFAVIVGKTSSMLMQTFIHLDFYTVFEVGFVSGLFTAASGFGFQRYVSRVRSIDVEKALREAQDLVQSSPKVSEIMGLHGFSFGDVQTGTLRVYQIDPAGFRQSDSTGLPMWNPPRIQLMFQIWGGSRDKQAVVCCEARTNTYTTQLEFTFVSFDLLESKSGDQGKNPTIIVVGDESKMHVRNDLRSFATMHRVYVKSLTK